MSCDLNYSPKIISASILLYRAEKNASLTTGQINTIDTIIDARSNVVNSEA